jgi:hypothetical protein
VKINLVDGHKHAKVSQLVILAQKVNVGEKLILSFLILVFFINIINCGAN